MINKREVMLSQSLKLIPMTYKKDMSSNNRHLNSKLECDLSELKKAHDEVAYIARAIFIQQSAAVQNEIIHCVEIETVHELLSKRTSESQSHSPEPTSEAI